MDTRSSFVRAVLLTGVLALVGSITLGCADEEAPTLLEPAPALTPVTLNDLVADSATAVDTAYVTQGSVENLVGAVVNEDGSITKGDIDIGSIFPPGPVGPTGTTGVPGTGSGGGGAFPDKAAPIFNPTGPQFEIWCMVRIWYIESTGEVLDAEILYCWDDGTGGGGSGGGGNNNSNQEITFTLSCDNSVTRGREGSCSVAAVNAEGAEVDISPFTISWSSSSGAKTSGKGKSTWEGYAVDDVTVTVDVGGFSGSKDISVKARFNWGPSAVRASRQFSRISTFGLYDLPPSPNYVPSPREGTGPWKKRWYMKDAPVPKTALYVHDDYSTGGKRHSGSNSTCSASSSLPSSSNAYRVNQQCNTLPPWGQFHDDIVLHERDHEDGINDCLTSSTASRKAMGDIEAITGSNLGVVRSAVQLEWNRFYNMSLQSSGLWARRFASGSRNLPTSLRHLPIQFSESSSLPCPGSCPSAAVTGSARLIQTSTGGSAAFGGPATKRSGRAS